jgi:site-specific DNA-methyltransferase (adenine-specific)
MTPYYADDLVTIYHGDCREWMPEADVIVTDPPYGIKAVHANGKTGGRGVAENRVYIPVHDDDGPMDVAFLLARTERKIIFGADHFAHPIGRLLVWDKRDGLASNNFADAEVAWDSRPGPVRVYRHRQMGMLGDGLGDAGRVHPTQKPEAVMRWLLAMTEGTILDPFMGSGSTLVAAKSLGRRSIGIEIEERYCEVAATRCSQEVLGLGA